MQRLIGPFIEMDDGQAPVAEANAAVGRTPQAGVIRSAMGETIAHALDGLGRDLAGSYAADDAAHQPV